MQQSSEDDIISDPSVNHNDDHYPQNHFESLQKMQLKHFWYVGRHKFILKILLKHAPKSNFDLIDFGGGCGGWVHYLFFNVNNKLKRLALADSSLPALENARKILPKKRVELFQVDLLNLGWKNEWDVVTLLDVIEHCPDDRKIMRQVEKTMRVGAKLVVTAPALKFFWSDYDKLVKHQKRYSRSDFHDLTENTNLKLVEVRYFMFFLSPLLMISRKFTRKNSPDRVHLEHKLPNPYVNKILSKIFAAETPLGHKINFPWGTSVIGIYEKVA